MKLITVYDEDKEMGITMVGRYRRVEHSASFVLHDAGYMVGDHLGTMVEHRKAGKSLLSFRGWPVMVCAIDPSNRGRSLHSRLMAGGLDADCDEEAGAYLSGGQIHCKP